MIVENGIGAVDTLEADGSVHAPYRITYHKEHITMMEEAVNDDGSGTYKRYKKDSFYWY